MNLLTFPGGRYAWQKCPPNISKKSSDASQRKKKNLRKQISVEWVLLRIQGEGVGAGGVILRKKTLKVAKTTSPGMGQAGANKLCRKWHKELNHHWA